jgi:hypothetical protein
MVARPISFIVLPFRFFSVVTLVMSEASRQKFLAHLDHASKLVATWPEWKRNLLGGYTDNSKGTTMQNVEIEKEAVLSRLRQKGQPHGSSREGDFNLGEEGSRTPEKDSGPA